MLGPAISEKENPPGESILGWIDENEGKTI